MAETPDIPKEEDGDLDDDDPQPGQTSSEQLPGDEGVVGVGDQETNDFDKNVPLSEAGNECLDSDIVIDNDQAKNLEDINDQVRLDNSAHSLALYEKLKKDLAEEEFKCIVDVTGHGLQRLIEREFSAEEENGILKNPTSIKTQKDGAKVFIKHYTEKKKISYIVIGEKGVVSALRKISSKSLAKLSKNYNWS